MKLEIDLSQLSASSWQVIVLATDGGGCLQHFFYPQAETPWRACLTALETLEGAYAAPADSAGRSEE